MYVLGNDENNATRTYIFFARMNIKKDIPFSVILW